MESPTSIRPFLRHAAFEFWSKCFTVVTIPSSQREGICTLAMHGYWQVVMASFEQELMGSRGFSLIPPDGHSAVISANLGCFYPLNLCWHMLGSRIGLPFLSGLRRIKDGYGMSVTIPRVGKRR